MAEAAAAAAAAQAAAAAEAALPHHLMITEPEVIERGRATTLDLFRVPLRALQRMAVKASRSSNKVDIQRVGKCLVQRTSQPYPSRKQTMSAGSYGMNFTLRNVNVRVDQLMAVLDYKYGHSDADCKNMMRWDCGTGGWLMWGAGCAKAAFGSKGLKVSKVRSHPTLHPRRYLMDCKERGVEATQFTASHLCHNPHCIAESHIVAESQEQNNARHNCLDNNFSVQACVHCGKVSA